MVLVLECFDERLSVPLGAAELSKGQHRPELRASIQWGPLYIYIYSLRAKEDKENTLQIPIYI